jgi:pSer/pThr/pTyr-binding forkhead associated (FHA) protein
MNEQAQSRERPVSARDSGPQGTQLFSAEELRRHRASGPHYDALDRASSNRPVLQGIGAAMEGKRVSLRAGRQTIGRGAENDIIIDDLSVSSSHAWIMNQNGHYVVMNTLSTNGTFVNDQRVHDKVIKHGDHVRFGQAEFVFRTREPGTFGGLRSIRILIGLLLIAGLGAWCWWWYTH